MARIFISSTAFSLLALMIPAQAQMAVIDTAAIGKWSEQINKMTEQTEIGSEQLDGINDISLTAKDTVDAIGKAGEISLPIINAAKLGSQVRKDAMCLMPDLEGLLPDLSFDDLNWSGICSAVPSYRGSLFIDPADTAETEGGDAALSGEELRVRRREINERRQTLLEDSVVKGLAGGDIANQSSEELVNASDELQQNVSGAKTQNDRLATIAQGQVLIVRAIGQQNQILAQLLKLHSLIALKSGLPVESIVPVPGTEGGPS